MMHPNPGPFAGDVDQVFTADDLLDVDELLAERDTVHLTERLDTELAGVRTLEPRVDAKATSCLQLSSALLVAVMTALIAGRLPTAAAVVAVVAAGLLLAAAVLLLTALRPALSSAGAEFGFVRWARYPTDADLAADLAAAPALDSLEGCHERVRQLRWLSASLLRKFTRLRGAQNLIVVALTAGLAAAVVAAIGR